MSRRVVGMTARVSDVIDDFTRGAPELRFCWPTRLPGAEAPVPAPSSPHAPTPILQAFTADGEDARLWLCEEGETVGVLMFEWLKRVVVRRGDRSAVFTVHRSTGFGSSARVSGGTTARVRRKDITYDAGSTRFTQAASGVLTGAHGEILVFDTPVDGELIRLKFTTAATPDIRAAMIAIALLYEHDRRS